MLHYGHHDTTLILPRMSIGDHLLLLLYFFYIVVYKKDNPGINIRMYPGGKAHTVCEWAATFLLVLFVLDSCI